MRTSDLLSIPVKEYPQFEAALSLLPVLPSLEHTVKFLTSLASPVIFLIRHMRFNTAEFV